jgi:catechol 2,3-dioxygenase-like lactoylglutathione lyase family enzyme
MRRRLIGVAGVVVLLAAIAAFLARAPTPTAGRLATSSVLHVNVNCSDFARSKAFYERLGFREILTVEPRGLGDVAAAVGLGPEYEVRGALLVHEQSGFLLDLLEWKSPRDLEPPHQRLNHLGLARLAFTTSDLTGDVAKLRADGVQFLSEAPGVVPDGLGGSTRFIAFRDPDGTVLELVELGSVQRIAQRVRGAP